MPILFVFSRPIVAFKNMHEVIEAVIVLIFDLAEPSRFVRFKCGALIVRLCGFGFCFTLSPGWPLFFFNSGFCVRKKRISTISLIEVSVHRSRKAGGPPQKSWEVTISYRIFSRLLSSHMPSSIRRWSGRCLESVGATPSSSSFNWQASSVKL